MNMRFIRAVLPAVLAAILAAAPGCGRKTDPATPDSPRPEAVTDLKAVVRDNAAYLTWSIPNRNVEGKNMEPGSIRAFRVYRAEMERDRKRPRYRQIAEIDMANPAPADVQGGKVAWTDASLQYNKVYGYQVRVYSAGGGVSQYSSEVRAAPLLSLAPPKKPAASAGDGSVTLNWDAVTTRADGSLQQGFVGYNVYRGTTPGRYEDAPVNKEPVRTANFRDTAVVNSTTYYYRVRAVDSPVLPWRESLDSDEVSATPLDQTSPAPPQGVTVVPGVGRVFLTWNENRERDLAGYRVYRSVKSGTGYERLADMAANRTTFSDETALPGMTYYYVITAVDTSGNESKWSSEHKTYTEKLR